MRLRQIALVAEALAPAEEELLGVLGLGMCYRDPMVARWGLENVLAAIGGNFLEIVAPTRPGTSAGRYLQRRGGNGGYMAILQCADALAERQRIAALGIRVVEAIDRPHYVASHFHPSDVGGVLLSVDSTPGADYREIMCDWPPAGPDWRKTVRGDVVTTLLGAEIQAADPAATAALWSRVLALPARAADADAHEIALENATLRFVRPTDGRGPGLGAIDVRAKDPGRVLREAEARGLKRSERQVGVCGCRVNLV
jgi:hypothetical protein